ncbi:hypothetical protein J2S76_004473 [Ancylobacter vacuolatus]|uniref:Uncharacterized protein n=1 Tax=Ancylobacter vacuolatus TaxID=223389 RepID=A0ABU0DNI2_9HYPH|nr:hypothetical protein [Ancylobacter vacuolatus]
MPVRGEGGVVRHRAFQTELAEPAIGEVEVNLFQSPRTRSFADGSLFSDSAAAALPSNRS